MLGWTLTETQTNERTKMDGTLAPISRHAEVDVTIINLDSTNVT